MFSDLALPKQSGQIDLALIPIGGYLTMDRHDAVVAAGLVGANRYIPCHYGTMPALETDPQAFKTDVENAGHGDVVVLDPGEELEP